MASPIGARLALSVTSSAVESASRSSIHARARSTVKAPRQAAGRATVVAGVSMPATIDARSPPDWRAASIQGPHRSRSVSKANMSGSISTPSILAPSRLGDPGCGSYRDRMKPATKQNQHDGDRLRLFAAVKVRRLARSQVDVQTYEIEQYELLLAAEYAR